MRILLSYPGHMFSTWDVAEGYEKALKALGHDVRVFDYHNRLAFYNSALAHFAEQERGFRRHPSDQLVMASESIILEAVDFVPDVVLMVNGMNLHRRAFDLLRRLCIPVVILLTESPYLDEIQATIASKGHVAGLLTNDRASVGPLGEATGLPVRYLPHSFDPDRHRPRPMVEHYRSDVFFWGTLWPERIEALAPLGELVDDYDIEIGGLDPADIDSDDLMTNSELANYYARTKIAINQHRSIISGGSDGERHIASGEAYSIGPRAYEIAACGAFQICDDTRPELHDVFNGHIPTYRDGAELLELVRYYLAHDDEREAKAAAALEAVRGCTFEARAQDIVIPFLTEVKELWEHHIQEKTA